MQKITSIPMFVLVNKKGSFLTHDPINDYYEFVDKLNKLKIWDWFDSEIASLLIKDVEVKNFYCRAYELNSKERKVLNVD